MDRPGLDARVHREALRGLGRLNWWSGASRPYRETVTGLARLTGRRTLEVLDVGTGGGDVAVALASWAAGRGIRLRCTLCDLSPRAVAWAVERARRAGVEARGLALDAVTGPLPPGHDLVMSSLFLHHLREAEAVRVLRGMAEAARHLVVITDLARSAAGLVLASVASRMLTRSPVVHADAVTSVRAALTIEEAVRLARKAGLSGAHVERCWPQRWRLTWRRP